MRFDENGVAYWLAIRKRSLPDFEKELQQGEAVDLYLIRVAAGRTVGNRNRVLLIERFTTAATINNQLLQETLDWIKRELPSNTKRNLRVEISGTCELKITDTLNNASISKASEYSLTFPDQEKADAVAGAFRRVIELCAGRASSGK
jgi:hypothetical protein